MDPNPSPDKKAGRVDRVLAAVLGGILLAFAGGAVISVIKRPSGADAVTQPVGRFVLRERNLEHVRPGDADHGRKLYGVHCASCHGVRGDGLGPAATYLWPAPRDHTDAAYMNSRSDQELYRAIAEGGKAVGRSPLMPSWKDRFDAFDAWNLVAFIRTLHARPPQSAPRTTYHEIVLSQARLEQVAGALGTPLGAAEHRVAFDRHYSDEDEILGLAAYPVAEIDRQRIALGMSLKSDGSSREVHSHHQVLLKGRPADEVDRFLMRAETPGAPLSIPGYEDLSGSLSFTVRKTALKVRAALDQEKEDVAQARKVYDVFAKSPAELPLGERLYLQNCGQCHGATGRLVGPWITEREFRPRNHADGSFMNRLSDEYVRSVIRYGGLYWNVSSAMPAHAKFSEPELGELLAFLRSLAVPKGDGRCPCAVMTASCMAGEGASCRCGEGHGEGKLCDHMRR